MAGLLAPEKKEVVLGEAEVRQLFKIAKVGTIAGSFVRSGVIPRTARVRVVRDGVEVYDGTLASLKRFKDDVREVREGRSEEHTSELQSRLHLVCRLLLEKKKTNVRCKWSTQSKCI